MVQGASEACGIPRTFDAGQSDKRASSGHLAVPTGCGHVSPSKFFKEQTQVCPEMRQLSSVRSGSLRSKGQVGWVHLHGVVFFIYLLITSLSSGVWVGVGIGNRGDLSEQMVLCFGAGDKREAGNTHVGITGYSHVSVFVQSIN